MNPQRILVLLWVSLLASGAAGQVITWTGNSNLVSDATTGPWATGEVHIIQGTITVPQGQTLTVQPGVIVKFGINRSMTVAGGLHVMGTAGNPVIITSLEDDSAGGDHNGNGNATTPAPGDWRRLIVNSFSANTILQHCEFRYGGTATTGMIDWSATSGTLQNVTIRDSLGHGLRFTYSGRATSVQNCVFDNCVRPVTRVRADAVTGFSNNTASGNSAGDVLFVDHPNAAVGGSDTWGPSATLNGSGVLALAGSVHVVSGASLAIDAGMILKWMGTNGELDVQGSLTTNGVAGNRVVLTCANDDAHGGDSFMDGPTAGAAGDWYGVTTSASGSVSLAYTDVLFAGGGSRAVGVDLGSGGGTLVDCRIADSAGSGLEPGSGPIQVSGCAFDNNALWAIDQLSISDIPNLTSCTAGGNGNGDAIVLGAGTLNASLTLGAVNSFNGTGVFVFRNTLTVGNGVILTLDAGVILKANPVVPATRLNVSGSLVCAGTPAAPVVFTSLFDDTAGGDTNNDGAATMPAPGDWNLVYFSHVSSGNSMSHTQVRYGGSGGAASVFVASGSPTDLTLDNCAVEDALGAGLDANGHVLVISDCEFNRCAEPVRNLDIETVAGMTGCTATGNSAGDVVRMDGSSVVGAISLSPVNTFGNSGVIVLDGSITIPTSASLVLSPGMIIKVSSGIINQFGTLQCNGTAGSPVVFTSTLDDTHGGDSLGDGPTTGSPGDWSHVALRGSTGTALTHTFVRYAGSSGEAINAHGSDATLDHVVVDHASGAGFDAALSATPSVTNSSFNHCDRPVANLSFLTAGGFANCSATGNAQGDVMRIRSVGAAGLQVSPGASFNGSGVFLVVSNLSAQTLTIDAGVILKFIQGTSMSWSGQNLSVNGTASAPVVFTSAFDPAHGGTTLGGTPGPGDWVGLEFGGTSTGTIANAYVGYAGAGGAAALEVYSSNLTFCDITIQFSAGPAMDLHGTAAPTLKNMSFLDNGGTAIEGLSWPALGRMIGTTAAGNGGTQGDATWIESPLVGEPVTIERDNYFGSCIVVTVTPNVNNASLQLGRGVIVKCYPGVELEVTTAGTGMEKVILTSIRDDSIAGDTNGDGGATVPAPGDWIGVVVSGLTQRHALVRYAGGPGGVAAAAFRGFGGAVQSCRAEFSAGHGFWFDGPSAVCENSVAFQNQGHGFWFEGRVRNCTAVGNGATGIEVLFASYCISWSNAGPAGSSNYQHVGTTPGLNHGSVVYSCGLSLGLGTPGTFGCGWTGYGNINVDPQFVDEANGDLRLSVASPCRNYALAPISQATLCDPTICTPWGTAGCSGSLAPHPEPPPPVRDHDEYPRPLDDDDTGPAPLVADLGAHERAVYTLTLTGETKLGTTPSYTVTGLPGTAVLLAGPDGPGFFLPNVGYLLMNEASWITFATVPVGTPLPVPLPLLAGLHDLRINMQAAILSPSGTLVAFTNVHQVRLHY